MLSVIAAVGAFLFMAAMAFEGSAPGPKPVLDPSQGDGGVSTFYVWDKEVPGTPGQLLRQEPLPEGAIGLPRRLYRPTGLAMRILAAWKAAEQVYFTGPQTLEG